MSLNFSGFGRFCCSFFVNLLAHLAVIMTIISPVVANAQSITINGTTPREHRPTIKKSSSGKPQINIVAPKSGISHNKYRSLSTNSGAIFNNSKTAGTSKTGGRVAANPNLARSGTAKVILNEVTGKSRSNIRGSVEVFGDRADVIIANENGITCDGCSFVNTNRATLTTGKPTVRGGAVDIRVRRGDVTIGRRGISGADVINLAGRHVIVDGKVSASREITVSGGAQYFDPATGRSRAAPTTAGRNAPYAIDASRFGSMSSGTIRIIGNESGLGVRAAGALSSRGSTSISSRGSAEVAIVRSKRNYNLSAATTARQASGASTVGGNAVISGRTVEVSRGASLAVSGDLTLRAKDAVVVAGEVRASDITVQADKQALNVGKILANEHISIVAGEIENRRSVSQNVRTTYGGPWARYVPYLKSFIARYPTNPWTPYYKRLLASATIKVPTTQVLGPEAVASGNTVALQATRGSIINYSRLTSRRTMTLYAAKDVINQYQAERDLISGSTYKTTYHRASIYAGGDLRITAARGSINNRALATARGSMSLSARGNISNYYAVASRDLYARSSAGSIYSNYALHAGRNMTLVSATGITTRGYASRSSSIKAGYDLAVVTGGTFTSTASDVYAGRNASITGRSINIAGLLSSSSRSAYSGRAYRTQTWTTVTDRSWRSSNVSAGGALALTATGGNIDVTGSRLTGSRSLSLVAAGAINLRHQAVDDTTSKLTRSWYSYTTGRWWWKRTRWGYRDRRTNATKRSWAVAIAQTNGNLRAESGSSLVIGSQLQFKGSLTAISRRGSVTIAKAVSSPGDIVLWAARDVTVNGTLNAARDFRTTARGSIVLGANVTAQRNASLWSGVDINIKRRLDARSNVTLDAGRNIHNVYSRARYGDLTVRSRGGSVSNYYYMNSGRYTRISARGAVLNRGYASRPSYIYGSRYVGIYAGSFENRGGRVWSGGNLAINARSLTNTGLETRSTSTRYSGRKYATERWTTVNRGTWRAGSLEARGNVILNARAGDLNNVGSAIVAGNTVSLKASGDINLAAKDYSDRVTTKTRSWYRYTTGRWWWKRTHWGARDKNTSARGTYRRADSTLTARNLVVDAGETFTSSRTRLTLDDLSVDAKNARLLSQTIRVDGLARFNVTSRLEVTGGSLTARDFNFARTHTVALNTRLDDLDSRDLVLGFYRNLENKGTLTGRDVSISSRLGWIKNTGTISASRDAALISLRETVNGDRIDASDYTVIENSGALRAGRDLLLDGYGNVRVANVNADNVVVKSRNADVTFTRDLNARGTLTVTAGRDIANLGYGIIATGLLSMFAGRDIRNEGQKRFFKLTSAHGCLGRACGKNGFTFTDASIESSTGVVLNAGRDIKNRGGLISGDNYVTLTAGRDIINEGLYGKYAYKDYYRTWSKRKWYGKRTRYVDKKYDERAALKTSVIRSSGGDVLLDAERDIYNVGALVQAEGNVRLEAGRNIYMRSISVELLRDYYYKKSSSWFGIIKLGSTSSKAQWNQFAKIRSVIDGGSVEVLASDSIYVKGASIVSGGETSILAGDHIIVEPNTDRKYKRIENKSSGLFGWFRNDYANVTETTTVDGSILNATTDLTLVSATGDIALSGSRLTAGRDITLSALNGSLYFNTALETAYEQTDTYSDNGIWWKSAGYGSYTETLIHNELLAGGEIKFVAPNGIVVTYSDNGSLDEALNKFASVPELAWMTSLRHDNRVQWNAVAAARETWDYEEEGLTAPAAALITIAVTIATSGALSHAAGGITGALGFTTGASATASTLAVQAGIKAGLQSLVNRAAISLINNKGDLGAVLDELGSDDALKALATSMVTAGLSSYLVEVAGLTVDLPKTADLSDRIVQDINRAIIRSTVSAGVSTSIQGGEFGDALIQAVRTEASFVLGENVAEEIGTAAEQRDWSTGSRLLAHAVLGCAVGAVAASDCYSGAIGGIAGETVGLITKNQIASWIEDNTEQILAGEVTFAEVMEEINEFEQYGVNAARLTSGLIALLVGGDPEIAAQTGANAAENNALCGGLCIGVVVGIIAAYLTVDGDGNPIRGLERLGAGEDPLSRAISSGVNSAVTLSYENFPDATAAVFGVLSDTGDAIDATITFIDDATGNTVSTSWNSLDESTRNRLMGSGKVVSIFVPAGSVRAIRQLRIASTRVPDITIRDRYIHHNAMVDDLVNQLEGQGYDVVTEVSFGSACGVGRCRPDVIYRSQDGRVGIIEVKTGDADLSIRQTEIFPQIENGDSIPRGRVAEEFGLIPGVPLRDQGYPTGIPIQVQTFPGI